MGQGESQIGYISSVSTFLRVSLDALQPFDLPWCDFYFALKSRPWFKPMKTVPVHILQPSSGQTSGHY